MKVTVSSAAAVFLYFLLLLKQIVLSLFFFSVYLNTLYHKSFLSFHKKDNKSRTKKKKPSKLVKLTRMPKKMMKKNFAISVCHYAFILACLHACLSEEILYITPFVEHTSHCTSEEHVEFTNVLY